MNVISQINDMFQGLYTTAVRNVFCKNLQIRGGKYKIRGNFFLQSDSGCNLEFYQNNDDFLHLILASPLILFSHQHY